MSDKLKMDFNATRYYKHILDENGDILDKAFDGGFVEHLGDAERVIREMHEVWTQYHTEAESKIQSLHQQLEKAEKDLDQWEQEYNWE